MSAFASENLFGLLGNDGELKTLENLLDIPPPARLPPLDNHRSKYSTFIPNKVANVQFDADGDVVLLLKNNKGTARFQVNSSILCMSSPVFRAMLGAKSHFKEAKELANCDRGMAPVEVNIEDDDPDVFAVILRILHHQNDSVPKVVKEDKLYQIAILCDKYDLRQALSCWLDKWIPASHDLRSVILPGSVAFQIDKRLFMAYVFRKEEVFKVISKDLILTYNDLRPFGRFENIPQAIVSAIMVARKAAITAMFSCIRQSISKYDEPMKVQCQYKRECCDAFVLGLLIREFKRIGVYPETPSIRQQSVEDIRDKIASMKHPEFAIFGDLKLAGSCGMHEFCKCGSPWCSNCINKKCMKCNKAHILPANDVNHANCAPIGSLVTEVTDIMTKIEGLEHSRFVRTEKDKGNGYFKKKKKDKGNIGSNVEANADLWNCLKYI